ncbi:hypothetical protein Tco_0058564 [Tanacetum coccineum]
MIEIVPVEEIKAEALQVKYLIIDWEIHTEGSRKYWKIIRVKNITEAYQVFEDMLKGFDREDLVTLWSLVKEIFRLAEPTEDKERALWVELKRLFKPDKDDVLWKLQRYIRNFVPTAVLTKSGIVPVSATRPINIDAPKSFVNSVNTAKGNKVTSAIGEQGINVVKSSACWVWRPKIKCWLYTTQQMVINSPCLIDNKELAIPGQMATDFCDKHNMVAFFQKPTGREEFHQIVDFLAGSHIRYALTANPTIYVSLIKQFWQTVTVDTVNDGEQQLTVTVDG